MDFKLQITTVPRHNGLGPIVGDVSDGDKEEFLECVFGGKSTFCFGDFPQLPVEAFNGVSGVDEPSNLGPELEHAAQALPISPPVCDRRGVFFAPSLLQFAQRDKGCGFVGSLIDFFEACAKRAAVLVVEVLDRVAHLVDDAKLLQSIGEGRLDGLADARQVPST